MNSWPLFFFFSPKWVAYKGWGMRVLCWKKLFPILWTLLQQKVAFSALPSLLLFQSSVGGVISSKCLVRTTFSGSGSCTVWSCSGEVVTELYFSWVCGSCFVVNPQLLGWYVWRSPLRFPHFLVFVFRLWTPTFWEGKGSRMDSCVKTTFILLCVFFQ